MEGEFPYLCWIPHHR